MCGLSQVYFEHSELYFFFRDLAEKLGWVKRFDSTFYPWVTIRPERRSFGGEYKRRNDSIPVISVCEAITMLKKAPSPRLMCIGGKVVTFMSNGIKLGCDFVDTATIDKIHKRLHPSD